MKSVIEGQLAPWRWRDGVQGLLTAAVLFVGVIAMRPELIAFWHGVVRGWSDVTGLSLPGTYQMPPPSPALLLGTGLVVLVLYAWAGRWHERLHPLRVLVRALCLVQASACLFFVWAPARFPYAARQHLTTLVEMGADFLSIIPLLLMLGWGLLNLPWTLRLLGSVAVLAYFALWLPHQVLLHAWILAHGSVLFMPLLMLCLGPLLDGWIFVALYAWLLSLTPRTLSEVRALP